MLMFPNFSHSCFRWEYSDVSITCLIFHGIMRSVNGIVERFLKIVARFKYIFLSQALSVITKFSYFSYYVTFFDI